MAAREDTALRTLAVIAAVALGSALLVTGSYRLSKGRIAANERAELLSTLERVLPPGTYDNALTQCRLQVTDRKLLGTRQPVDVFVASKQGQPVAALFTSVAPDGYNGPIRLLVGVSVDGVLTGVRVLEHRETPGLGDQIETAKSDWITRFTGKSLKTPPPRQWTVKREGGAFDAFTGATITPRAVIKAVENTLVYFNEHRDELFARADRECESRNAAADE
jgi:electron transport complex protein RnfG